MARSDDPDLAKGATLPTTNKTPATDETLPASDATLPSGGGVQARERRPAGDAWAPGTRIGHYVVLALLGRGGMGEVYRAEDVDLGRPVAIKRLLASADPDSRARLLREARAAAALQHPNVVTVHEVGEHEGAPFLAMELVDGMTLTAWLRDKPRTWREIVAMVAQAAHGLAAAHERGLVHRDFKPDNVLVDRAGRARVADFGLARAGDAEPEAKGGAVDGRLARMTATGALAGTPAYMAPELVEGGAADARSDQYALAITLWEALQGEHPFSGTTASALWVEMAEGRVRAPRRKLPAWLDRDVRRGLEVDPAKRWPDVATFLRALERPPRRRAAWAAAAALVVLGGAGIFAFGVARRQQVTCEDLARHALPPVLDSELAAALTDPAERERALQALNNFTSDYRRAVGESCRATRTGTQSAALADKRTSCLELTRRRAQDVFIKMINDRGKGASVALRLEDMPDLWPCSDSQWLARPSPPAVNAEDRAALLAAEEQLARATKLRDAGELAKATQLVATSHETAMRAGDRSLAARAFLLAVELDRDRGDLRAAETDAMDAWTAASAYGDNELTLRAQLAMIGAVASHDKRALEGFAGLGKDVTESAGGAWLVTWYGDALASAGRFPEAEAEYRRAQAIRERVLPADHVDRALGLQRLGGILAIEKRATEALQLLDQSQPAIDRAFPPLRREAIEGLRFRAIAESELGHHDKALELEREIVRRRTKVLGEGAGFVLEARADVALTLGEMGRNAEAAAEYEPVIAGHLARDGEKSVNAADARVELANQLVTLGRFADADAALARAVPVIVAARGEDSPYTFVARYSQVRSYTERPKPIELAQATKWLDQMEPVFAKLFGKNSQPIASVHGARARILLARGDAKQAAALLAGARAMLDDSHRTDRAELELLDARAQLRLGNRDAALAAAEAARADYAAAGDGYKDRAEAAKAWQAHPQP